MRVPREKGLAASLSLGLLLGMMFGPALEERGWRAEAGKVGQKGFGCVMRGF